MTATEFGDHLDGAVAWLLERTPDGLPLTHFRWPVGRHPVLIWDGPITSLYLKFLTPHDLKWTLVCRFEPTPKHGTFNLAMNLQEITDLIRDTLEPSS